MIETRGNWRKIRARGTVGWVHKSMIQPEPLLEVNFVDVGQGDGCFIVTPDRKYLLVDAGPEDHLYRFLRWYFADFKAEVTFDAAIITHPDSDHYAGFGNFFDAKDPALKNVRFRRIYHNGIVDARSEAAFCDGVAADRARWMRRCKPKVGTSCALCGRRSRAAGSRRSQTASMLSAPRTDGGWTAMKSPATQTTTGWKIQVLGPVPEDDAQPPRLRWYGDEGKTKNGNSIVLRLVYKNVSILLGGDLNVPAEEYLLAHYGKLGITGEPGCTREKDRQRPPLPPIGYRQSLPPRQRGFHDGLPGRRSTPSSP